MRKKLDIIWTSQFKKDYKLAVNYPRPKGHGLVTAQSY